MLKFLVYLFLFLLAGIMQTVVVPHIEILGARPSFFLILTVITALRHGSLSGCFMGFMSGLLCDIYAPIEWLGAFSLAYCAIGFLFGQIKESFIDLSLFLKIVALILADFLKDAIYYFSIGTTVDEIPNVVYSLSFPNALYTVAIGAIFFYLLSMKKERRVEMHKPGL